MRGKIICDLRGNFFGDFSGGGGGFRRGKFSERIQGQSYIFHYDDDHDVSTKNYLLESRNNQ